MPGNINFALSAVLIRFKARYNFPNKVKGHSILDYSFKPQKRIYRNCSFDKKKTF